jgi:hypothetical protein
MTEKKNKKGENLTHRKDYPNSYQFWWRHCWCSNKIPLGCFVSDVVSPLALVVVVSPRSLSPLALVVTVSPHDLSFSEKNEKIPLSHGLSCSISIGRLVVVIDVNPSHGFWTARLIKVFGHEG